MYTGTGNVIGDEGAKAISVFLKVNRSLTELHLGSKAVILGKLYCKTSSTFTFIFSLYSSVNSALVVVFQWMVQCKRTSDVISTYMSSLERHAQSSLIHLITCTCVCV